MSKARRGHDLPPWALRAVERAGQSGLLMAIGAPLVRADSPSYVQLRWTEADLPVSEKLPIVYGAVLSEGDRGVTFPRNLAARFWPNARIVTAPWNVIEAIEGVDQGASQVAGYITSDQRVHVGVLPDGQRFGTVPGESGTAALAFRQGREASRLFMAMLRDSGELVIPGQLEFQTEALRQSPELVRITELADRYPGVPLV